MESHGIFGLPEVVRYERSKSFPDSNRFKQTILDQCALAADLRNLNMEDSNNCSLERLSKADIKKSLRQEIVHLKKMLNDQVHVRGVLENALSSGTLTPDYSNKSIIPETATELIRETAVLELEVKRLERSLLSMYRKVFDEQIPSLSSTTRDGESMSPQPIKHLNISRSNVTSPLTTYAPQAEFRSKHNSRKLANSPSDEQYVDSDIQYSHSALYKSSPLANTSSLRETLGNSELYANHSQPLSTTKVTPLVISLAEHLGSRISNRIPELPNKLSENMVKSMSSIYCKFADPSLATLSVLSSSSSLSSASVFSSKDQSDFCSRRSRNDYSSDGWRLDNPFCIEVSQNLHGPYKTMVEVNCMNKEIVKLSSSKYLLQNFRTLISQLEYIDPRKMTHDEKLAFWINVYNALVMHAYLVFGLPRSNREKMLLLTKAAYNIGGQIMSADVIRNSILGCRMSYSGLWIRWLVSTRTRFKAFDERHGYAIERSEPLLHFALASGNYYDPAVLVYTPKKVFQKLEVAKEDYIRSTVYVHDRKIHAPKLVETYAKEYGLCSKDITKMIRHFLPDSVRENVGLSRQNFKGIPHNFSFRYLISKDQID